MLGPVLTVLVLLIAIPVGVSMLGATFAVALGWALKDHGDKTHEGSELLELS